jgi:hypothetical protein
MDRYLRLVKVTVLGVVFALEIVPVAIAAPTVKGDTAAWNDVVAAYRRLYALPGYRMSITFPDGRVATAEFARPDAHWSVPTPQGPGDSYLVGGMYVVQRGGRCTRLQTGRPNMPNMDLTNFKGEVTVGRKPDTTIDGLPVHDYAYVQVSPGGSQSRGDVYLVAQTGLPRRVVNMAGKRTGGSQQPNTIDYYDYGAKITIAPPC